MTVTVTHPEPVCTRMKSLFARQKSQVTNRRNLGMMAERNENSSHRKRTKSSDSLPYVRRVFLFIHPFHISYTQAILWVLELDTLCSYFTGRRPCFVIKTNLLLRTSREGQESVD